jgi:hypothetical protein
MSIWFLIQIVVNIFLVAGVALCLIKVFRDREDDPRLTQGLRLLQSKISILEDLSDHTENQVKQLMTLLDKKLHEVRHTIHEVHHHIGEVDRSIQKSQKMAQEIQNEIMPDRLVEKKLENKYIQAAQLAHQGRSVSEIVQALGLPQAEVELIVKVNQKKCVYGESQATVQDRIFQQSLEMPQIQSASLAKTQMGFTEAVQDHKEQNEFRMVKLG